MAEVPSVDEIRRKYANEIAAQKADKQRLRDEAAQARQRRDIACNKHILDTISNDTKNAQSYSNVPKYWRFDATNCNVEPSIAILEQKGYTIGYDFSYGKEKAKSGRFTKYESFTVKLNKY